MKKLLYLFILFYLYIITVFAQDETQVDFSVYRQVVTSPQDSVTKYKDLSREAYRSGDLKSFKTYSDIVLAIAEANNLEETKIRVLVNIAIYYQQTDQYEQSLDSYLKAEKLAESLPRESYIKILIQVNLGNLYIAIGNYDMAILAMKEVIALADIQENPDQFYNVAYSIMGNAYLHQKKFLEALKYMQLSKDLAIKANRKDFLIRSMINISECYVHLGRYQDAIDNSTQILELITEEESIESKALTQLTIGAAYMGLNEPKKALAPLIEAKDIGITGNFLKIQMDSHDYLAQVYEATDDLNNSLKEQKLYIEAREKYLKTLSKAQRLEIEKESEKKSDIISQQEKSLVFLGKEKRVYVFAAILLVALLIVSSVIYSRKRRKMTEESLQLHDDKLLLQNENEALKDKLNALAIKIQKKEAATEEINEKQLKKTSITQADQQKYMKLILDYMEKEKPFLDHEIKQSDIANNLKMSIHLFSEVLNVCFKKNFNNFINLYRVDAAKALMKDPKYKHYKILEIGYEAGFPSKTSFNRVFKNLVGHTPSEYQKSINTVTD